MNYRNRLRSYLPDGPLVPSTRTPVTLTRSIRVGAVVVAALLSTVWMSCTSTSVSAPSTPVVKCQVTLTGPQATLAAVGESSSVGVNAAAECAWTASATAPWITALTPANGQGNGNVQFRATANTTPGGRQADITVNNVLVRISQEASPCTFDVAPRSLTVSATGGSSSVSVTSANECSWSVASQVPWITITSPATSAGAGGVTFDVAANSAGVRTGTITVAGVSVAVIQESRNCSYVVEPANQIFGSEGGPGTLTVTAGAACGWAAAADVPWITILSGTAGTANGAVAFTVAPNTASPRAGHISVGSQVVTVQQEALPTCTYSINPTSASTAFPGGPGSVAITTTATCAWTATTNVSWISVAAGGTGTGPGSVSYTVAGNTGAARSGSMLIAGRPFTVTQAAAPPCVYSVAPLTQSAGASGGAATPVVVTTQSYCTWTAVTNDAWLVVTSAVGTGTGTVQLSIGANSGAARSGTLTIADQTVTINQAAAPCVYTIAPLTQSVVAAGGSAAPITVTTQSHCTWTVVNNDAWLIVTSAGGSGTGTVNVSVGANGGVARSGTLTIADQTVTINQAAVPCVYTVAPLTLSVVATGGSAAPISVTPTASCGAWTMSIHDSWLHVTTGGGGGTGNGIVQAIVDVNNGPARAGTLTVAGQTVTINQAAVACVYTVVPLSQSVGAAGGPATPITITTSVSCGPWTAASNDSWLQVTSGASGSGNGTVQVTVGANSGPGRAGTLTIAGQTVTINQGVGCAFSATPPSQSAPAGGGAGTPIAVTTTAGCNWTAVSNDAWLQITGGAGGSGSGSVSFNVLANSGGARSGTMTVAGQTVTVSQAAAVSCAFTATPPTQSATALGGAGTPIAVTTTAGCNWTAVSNDAWLQITAGASGSGSGSVSFNVVANLGSARSGTMTVAGQIVTVNQAAFVPLCSFGVNPSSANVGSAAGTGTNVAVTTQALCAWTAASNDGWIHVTSGAIGSGSGIVGWTYDLNTGVARTGTMTIAGQTFTVSQAAPCSYLISPPNQSFTTAGGTGGFTVTTAASCGWTATTVASWLTINSGTPGNGNGSVGFTVAANATGSSRVGTIVVAGQNFTVNQQ